MEVRLGLTHQDECPAAERLAGRADLTLVRVSRVWRNEQREQLAVAAAYLSVAIAVRLGTRDDTEPLFTEPDEFLVRLLAHELDELVLVGDVDRVGGVVRLGGVGAPPV